MQVWSINWKAYVARHDSLINGGIYIYLLLLASLFFLHMHVFITALINSGGTTAGELYGSSNAGDGMALLDVFHLRRWKLFQFCFVIITIFFHAGSRHLLLRRGDGIIPESASSEFTVGVLFATTTVSLTTRAGRLLL